MQVHFSQRNVWDTLFILEEGNLPYPWCPHWKILAPWCDLNGRHLSTAQYAKGLERERRRLVEENLRKILERDFQAYREPLETVTLFKYMVRVMTAGE